ncbi:histidine kinase [Streptomyces sp. SID161]|uniref:sensor histidine kinase n=1 Tax=unclassified Streptomyces TaxID=2593676 RepID=UPI00136FE205|nr:histidine kinase [Streptomyces sp. SID161]MYW43073.1 two-component sensor histidine kinase [Streptomyces sp. SID161]MYW45207.1 two-component sensor histidine kinase [Streptomyces sp. SID161]
MTRRPPPLLLDGAAVALALLDVWAHWDVHEPLRMACGLAAAVALLLRRRRPMLTFLLTLPSVLLSDAVVACLAALYTLASFRCPRTLLVLGSLAFAFADTTSLPSPELDLTSPPTLIALGYSTATAAAAVFLGQLVQTRRDLSLRLTEISQARDHQQLLTAQAALAKERAQLAREMHDVVSHQVSLIAVHAGALQVGTSDPDAKEAAATIRRLSVQTLDELRHMVGVLRASGGNPTDLTPQPALIDLQRLADNSGIETELRMNLPEGLPPPVQRAVYRTVQEALTNARKHAPGATARIDLFQAGGSVHVKVTNTAPTQPPLTLPGAHHGLIGLRQRAELLGGTMSSGPTADGGYEVCVVLPAEAVG